MMDDSYNDGWFLLVEDLPLTYCSFRALWINHLKPTCYVMHHQFNIQQLYAVHTHCIYVFCIYLRTNSDLCHLQHKLIGFYNRDEKCLQRGTDWIFNHLKPTGYVMHQQFNIQQLYALPTLYLCVLYLSEKKQRRVPLTV